MNHTHTIRIIETLEAKCVELADFTADVTVNCIPAYGDGFNEPREPAHYELSRVLQISGPYIMPSKLADWADAWVADNQTSIASDILASEPF